MSEILDRIHASLIGLCNLAQDRKSRLVRPATPALDTRHTPISHDGLHRIRRQQRRKPHQPPHSGQAAETGRLRPFTR